MRLVAVIDRWHQVQVTELRNGYPLVELGRMALEAQDGANRPQDAPKSPRRRPKSPPGFPQDARGIPKIVFFLRFLWIFLGVPGTFLKCAMTVTAWQSILESCAFAGVEHMN